MTFITRVLFEDALLLGLLCLVLLAIAVGVDRSRRTPQSRRLLYGALATIAVLFVIQSLVVTDREALEALVRTLVHRVDEGDVGGIGELVDPGGVTLGQTAITQDEFIQMSNVGLQNYTIDEAGAGNITVQIAGDNATVSFQASCDIRGDNTPQQRMPSAWTIGAHRTSAGWKLNAITKGEIGLGGILNSGSIPLLPYLQGFLQTARSSAP